MRDTCGSLAAGTATAQCILPQTWKTRPPGLETCSFEGLERNCAGASSCGYKAAARALPSHAALQSARTFCASAVGQWDLRLREACALHLTLLNVHFVSTQKYAACFVTRVWT